VESLEEKECEQEISEESFLEGEGDNGENRERDKGLECADVSLCAVIVITGGVVKPSEARGLC
jgi:hypothetical protein